MYALATEIIQLPIISLQTGEAVALVTHLYIDLSVLELVALSCKPARQKNARLLVTRDVRQFAGDCIIIDSEDELIDPREVVRLQAVISTDYSPNKNAVVTESGRRLGLVEDYTVNLETFRVQKLYLKKSLIRDWLGAAPIIDRTQIIDITGRKITVRDTTVKAPVIPPKSVPEAHP